MIRLDNSLVIVYDLSMTNHEDTYGQAVDKIEALLDTMGLEFDEPDSSSPGEFTEFRRGGLIITVQVADEDEESWRTED